MSVQHENIKTQLENYFVISNFTQEITAPIILLT